MMDGTWGTGIVLYGSDMHFLIFSELHRDGAALFKASSQSVEDISLHFKDLTNSLRAPFSETEHFLLTLNGKQQ